MEVAIALLLVAAVGMAIGGVFVTDPITTTRDAFTVSGTLHHIGGALMIFPAPILDLLISVSLVRHTPNWRPATYWLLVPSVLVWMGLVAFIFISATRAHDVINASVAIGLPSRFFIFSYCAWMAITARQAIKVKTVENAATPV